jgi:NAD(P)-dependent dehydrogenase (short-subunit alcohol dehydrogenase family)
MDEAAWDAVIDVHLKGHFCPSRHAGAYWRDRAKAEPAAAAIGRRIINTTSEAGLFGSAGQANYAAAKGAIVSLTWVFAREYGRYGVTANVIAPRARTQMTESMAGFEAPAEGDYDRFDPDNVSRVVAWLATDDAAEVNGQVFIVIGGDVHLVRGFEVVSSVHHEGPWPITDLIKAKDELFGERSSKVPRFGGPLG